MIGASFFRGTLLILIATLAWAEILTFPLLTLCLVLISLSGIVSGAANGVHLRDLVRQEDWPRANGKIESLVWIMSALATPLGGVVIVAANPGVVLAINGAAYVCSGLLIRRIPQQEPPPAPANRARGKEKISEVLTGWRNLLLWACAARSIWAPFLAFSPSGVPGLLFILICECSLMFAAGLFNPVFATYRMQIVDRALLARVGSAWPISAALVQPVFLLSGALLVEWLGTRTAIGIIGACMLLCIPLIPWRAVRASS